MTHFMIAKQSDIIMNPPFRDFPTANTASVSAFDKIMFTINQIQRANCLWWFSYILIQSRFLPFQRLACYSKGQNDVKVNHWNINIKQNNPIKREKEKKDHFIQYNLF